MDSQGTILVVGSGGRESDRVRKSIQEGGFDAIAADDWQGSLRELYNRHPDVAVLLMESMDWANVERIREVCDIPIVLVAPRATRSSLQRAFDLGLDGYLVQPLQPGELVGRLIAVVQKTSNHKGGHNNPSGLFRHETLAIDRRKMEVWLDDEMVHLSPTEFRLLSLLAERRGWVVTYDEILTKVWGPAYIGDRNNVKLYIWYLRRKIEADPANPRWIVTKYGVGYTFCPERVQLTGNGRASNH